MSETSPAHDRDAFPVDRQLDRSKQARWTASRLVCALQLLRRQVDAVGAADVYFGRGQTILQTRERIKRETINQRRLLHQQAAA
jgi:hypothetical protein